MTDAVTMQRHLKHAAFWGAATAYWAGVISEAIAVCVATPVCSYPQTALPDAAILLFLASMTTTAARAVKQRRD